MFSLIILIFWLIVNRYSLAQILLIRFLVILPLLHILPLWFGIPERVSHREVNHSRIEIGFRRLAKSDTRGIGPVPVRIQQVPHIQVHAQLPVQEGLPYSKIDRILIFLESLRDDLRGG